jgi:type II secretory pathway pseudopilin PulG
MTRRVCRNGSTLITCTLVLLIVSVLAVSLASVSGVNLQIASNQHQANCAFASAESGLEVSRYWLSRVRIRSDTPPSNYLGAIIATATVDLEDNGVSNFRVSPTGAIPAVMLHPLPGYTFQGQWSSSPGQPEILHVATTGISGLMARTITVEYRMKSYRFPIFNYGIATQGPVDIAGVASFSAATQSWEADAYVGSRSSWIAIDAGKKATFAGDVLVGNSSASISPNVTIDGETSTLGPDEERPEFPVPNVVHFRQYATGPVIGPGTDLSEATWTNAVVAAGTNPQFTASNVTIQGILYIEPPNIVTFRKNVTLQGMIVAAGDVNDPGTNQINIGDPDDPKTPSNFSSGPYPPGPEFDALRQEQGSCILAPGFRVAFWKNFSAINGVIAASGLTFDKNATATVKGTLISYTDEPVTIGNNINMTFDRTGMVEIPAGFDLYRVPAYDPGSYTLAY